MSTERFARFGKEKRYDLHPHLLDIHVERLIEAHRQVEMQMKDSSLLHSGLLVFRNLLGKETAKEIAQEILGSTIKDGLKTPTLLKNRTGASKKAQKPIWEILKGHYQDRMMKRLETLFLDQTYLQHLLNEPDDGDDQKVFHSDTFFPCVKFWYFPQKVEKNDGPFWYVPYSAQLTYKLVDWHRARVVDLQAGNAEAWRGVGHKEGSFRISPEEIESLGLEAIPVCVEEDTLVIANVHGFHKRGDVDEPKHRVSIHGSIRFTPFC